MTYYLFSLVGWFKSLGQRKRWRFAHAYGMSYYRFGRNL